jgi:hypothetical protein
MGCFAARFAILLTLVAASAHGQARFDLDGPKVDIRVSRAGMSLPIAAVPNLQAGDVLWLHPDLPSTQSVHYLLIAAFLRGTTNPPPDDWFTRIETWKKEVREEGVFITVPPEAEQAVLFLAPETIGDFSTLRSAVQGRPGIFVRATQDLTEASFEQSRVETYLADMKRVPPSDPAALLEHSNLLARTLNLKPNTDCFKRPLDQQYNCLIQTGSQTLLDDGHGQSLVNSLSTGSGSDFINAASTTRLAAGGNYSAYVGALVDFTRLVSTIHTAQYQYIPAIAVPTAETLNLKLNTAPSFHNPKSVIVIGLPAIQTATPPPLRPADPDHISCLLDPHLVLPVDGAPLVFSTSFAHNIVLHLNIPADDQPGKATEQDLPLAPDAFQGGLVLAPRTGTRRELPLDPAPAPGSAKTAPAPQLTPIVPGQTITGIVEGFWGFDHFSGPTLSLQQTPGQGWHIVGAADSTLIAGQPNHLQLLSSGTACIESIRVEPGDARLDWRLGGPPDPYQVRRATAALGKPAPGGKTVPSPIKPVDSRVVETTEAQPETAPAQPLRPRPVELTLNLQHAATPGSIQLAIQQFGQAAPDQLGTRTFSQPARIQSLSLHAGDSTATLTGDSLRQVKSLQLKELTYTPETSTENVSILAVPQDTHVPFKPGERIVGQVHLVDGRTLEVQATVEPPRPAVTLLSRRVVAPAVSPIQLASPNDLPLGDQLLFFLKSKAAFARAEKIEVAETPSADAPDEELLHTTLSLDNGLVLQDSHTVLATFDPLKTFGSSTFGPFRMRAISPDGTTGEWLPLTTIVRLPTLASLSCPALTHTARTATRALERALAHASAPSAQSTLISSATEPKPAVQAPASPASGPASGSASEPATVSPPASSALQNIPAEDKPVATPCTLSGTALYLIRSLALDSAFTEPIQVPEGFVDATVALPRPSSGTLFLKLRDDPQTIQTVTLPLQTGPVH